jgi:hypothetical protein
MHQKEAAERSDANEAVAIRLAQDNAQQITIEEERKLRKKSRLG